MIELLKRVPRYYPEIKLIQITGIWSNGYFVSTVGANEEMIRKYIERQGQEDIGQEIVTG